MIIDFQEAAKKVVDHYGAGNQIKIAMEEAAEYIQAISKCDRNPGDLRILSNLASEIADLMFTVKQIMYIYDISQDLVNDWIENKINRTYKRMEKENERFKERSEAL